jgi:hypothetical protein
MRQRPSRQENNRTRKRGQIFLFNIRHFAGIVAKAETGEWVASYLKFNFGGGL